MIYIKNYQPRKENKIYKYQIIFFKKIMFIEKQYKNKIIDIIEKTTKFNDLYKRSSTKKGKFDL